MPWMWASAIFGIVSLILLINPKTRANEKLLGIACVLVFLSLWIEKGMGLVITGFVPNPLGVVSEYIPTFPEIMISVAIWCMGFLLITALYKIALSVRGQLRTE